MGRRAPVGGWGKGSDHYPAQLYNLADDVGETHNLYAQFPDRVDEMSALMEQLVRDGRSTPGPTQSNDQSFNWKRFLKDAKP